MGLISRVSSRTYRSKTNQTMEIQAPRVELTVTSTTKGFMSLQKLDRSLTILNLKCKLELVTGIPAGNQKLNVFDSSENKVIELSSNEKQLGFYPIEDNYRIHVTSTDTTPLGLQHGIMDFNDTSKVEKMEMSDEAYDKMKGSVRDFKRKMKMGRFNAEEMKQKEEEKAEQDRVYKEMQEDKVKGVAVGSRCMVEALKNPARRGTVMYVGKVHFKDGIWVGVRLDEPFGKNNGSVEGKRYFECQNKYGSFVKVECVTCGDFPEEDDDLDGLDEI